MDIQLIKERDNTLLKRKEITFKVAHDGPTPSRKNIIERLAATIGSRPGLVIVDQLKTEFGKREIIGYAKIYESEDRVKELERDHIIERNAPKAKSEPAEGAS